MTLEAADRIAIHELLGLDGHLIDERRWSELQVFSADAVYDATSFGQGVTTTLAALIDVWSGDLSIHPLAHHATNIVVSEDPHGTVTVLSKGIGVGRKGRVGSVTYRDVAVRTPAGWRLASRTPVLRRSEDR
jgi:SnoaL-like domain